jgi:hypothetical protein
MSASHVIGDTTVTTFSRRLLASTILSIDDVQKDILNFVVESGQLMESKQVAMAVGLVVDKAIRNAGSKKTQKLVSREYKVATSLCETLRGKMTKCHGCEPCERRTASATSPVMH